jgi:hypothetical protein
MINLQIRTRRGDHPSVRTVIETSGDRFPASSSVATK